MTTKKKQSDVLPNLVEHLESLTESNTEQETPFDVPGTTAWSLSGAANTKKNLATALVRAQAECQNVVMNKTNPHFRSRYADLAAVRDAIIPVFTRHGLSIIQCPNMDIEMGVFHLETRLIHTSGEEMVWCFPLPSDVNKMQSIGSAISYARRYTLSAVAAVASEEDDDGNASTATNGGGSSGGGAARRAAAPTGVVESGGIVL